MPNIGDIINILVAPVILITAAALLLLGIYGRLQTIVSRVRTFEELIHNSIEKEILEKNEFILEFQQESVKSYRKQTKAILKRAEVLKWAIRMYELTILFMILSGMCAALTLANDQIFRPLTLVLVIIGMISLAIGIILSLTELGKSLGSVELAFMETTYMEKSVAEARRERRYEREFRHPRPRRRASSEIIRIPAPPASESAEQNDSDMYDNPMYETKDRYTHGGA